MGVLVHPNYSDEKSNGVAVSHDPISFSPNVYYVNTQIGEDLVTNPEAKSYPEQLLLDSNGKASVLARSNHAPPGQLLMSDAQLLQLRRHLEVIHNRFKQLYQVKDGDQFAIEIEFKITAENKLAIKQARPWVFAETISLKPTVSLSFAGDTVTEGSPLNLALTRRGGDLSKPLDVDLEWTDPDGQIQGSAPASAQFPADQATLRVSVPTVLTAKVEPDSTITVRIKAKIAYGVGAPSTASVTVTDKIGTKPEVSITAGGDVTEGEAAMFTLTANPAPTDSIAVRLTVSGDDDYIYERDLGQRTVIIPAGDTTATVRIGTWVDSLDEAADGRIVATLDTPLADAGYTVSDTAGSARIAVADDDNIESVAYMVAPTVIANVKSYAAESQHGADHVNRWRRVLVAFGELDPSGVTGGAMTSAEAQRMAGLYDPNRWNPVVAELTALEAGTVKPVTIYILLLSDQLTEGGPLLGASGLGSRAMFRIALSRELLAGETVVVPFNVEGDADAWRLSDPHDPSATFGARSSITFDESDGHLITLFLLANDDTDSDNETITIDFDSARPPTLNGSSTRVTLGKNSGFDGSETTATRLIIIDDDPPQPPTPVVSTSDADYQTVVDYLIEARDNPPNPAMRGNAAHVRKWNRVLAAIGHDSGESAMPVSEIHDNAAKWPDSPFKAASDYLKSQEGQGQQQTPEVSVSAGGGVTEGGDATFTVTASPAPSSNLDVSVTVSQSGDYGATTGQRTVTIPTSGSVTLTVGTADDHADEPDGSVTATVNAGDGYTVSTSQGAATVSVADDDDAPVVVPVVSIAAGGGVTEGGAASFTVSASPSPASALDVTVTVTASGDFGVTTGQRTVRIAPGQSRATFAVGTSGDQADESDGSVTATLVDGTAYDLGSSKTATVAVADDDPPLVDEQDEPDEPVLTACEGRPELLISNPTANRGDASVDFEVSLSCNPSSSPLILLSPVRDGDIGQNLFVDLTSEQTSITVTVTIGGERELGLALVWGSGLANREAQGDVVFTD